SSPTHALATDGQDLFMATRRTSTSANFYALSPLAAGAPVLLGTNTGVWYVTGLAADSQYFYVASNGSQGEGVYRLSRSAVADPPVKLASINTDTLSSNIEVDDFATAGHVYVRDDAGDVHAIIAPATGSSAHIGAISTLGTGSDYAMTYDKAEQAIYLFETENLSTGRIVVLK
ncbi:MAG TPA: hypothetical protein VLS89_09015, partial [Candidatus Nanopelagicales bacterium]|nr:hypothetical protein [Candidatus Nanopelagicales bacterium]